MTFFVPLLFLLIATAGPAKDANAPAREVTPAGDAAVPVEQEPYHRSVFKNDYVQAFRVTLQPGETTLMHTHVHDDAAVRLSEATVASDRPGEPLGPPEEVRPGFVSARDNEAKPTTHRVHNIGKTPFDVVDVQVLQRPPGPESDAISEPVAENPKMRAYRYEIAPGASTPQHAHKRPYLLVAATGVDLRMTSPDGRTTDHPVQPGDMHWVEAAVTHAFANLGTSKAILVEIELK